MPLDAISRLAGQHILVVGDLFLDEYLVGRALRLSREAPIPVLEFEERRTLPGGGANPAMNIVALGARATQVGLVGNDPAGQTLTALLEQAGIDTQGLVSSDERPTATKTRIMAQGSLRFPQQIARLDRLDRRPISGALEQEITTRIARLASQADAILLSDYGSGLATPAVIAALRQRAGQLITVDSQGRLGEFGGFDLLKCNHHEAQAFMARALQSESDYQTAMEFWRRRLGLGAMLITRGPQGMSLHSDEGYVYLPAANRSEVYDVTGAGDTVIAVATLARAAGCAWKTAARLAACAAGLVVRKLGVATVLPHELAWAVEHWSD